MNLEELNNSIEHFKRQFSANKDKWIDYAKTTQKEIANDPLFRAVAPEQLAAADQWEITTVRRALYDKMLWKYLILQKAVEHADNPGWLSIFSIYQNSVMFVWDLDVWRAMQDSPVPEHIISENMMPYEAVFFDFSAGIVPPDDVVDPPVDILDALLIYTNPLMGQIHTISMGSKRENGQLELQFVTHAPMNIGSKFPSSLSTENARAYGIIISAFSFLNTQIDRIAPQRLTRQERRHELLGSSAAADEVRFVDLRSLKYEDSGYDSNLEGTVDWKYRWLVRGHHRAQWLPSSKSHELRWIAPYIKGPEGKPLKERLYHVIR